MTEGTEYVVLWNTHEIGDVWAPFRDTYKADRKEDAIKDAILSAENHDDDGSCSYRAVPASSWRDEFVVETEPRVRRKR